MYGFAFVGLSATVLYPMVTGVRDADVVFDAFGVLYDLTVAGLPEEVQTVATAVRSVAFAGMGAACLRTRSSRTPAP